jgi:hypothetical protein
MIYGENVGNVVDNPKLIIPEVHSATKLEVKSASKNKGSTKGTILLPF